MSTTDEYEYRVWKRGLYDWAWELRHGGRDSVYNAPLTSGRADTRKEAKAAIKRTIQERDLRRDAKWKTWSE